MTRWVDCGVCGGTHEDLPADCRAFKYCPKCGDGFHVAHFEEHVAACNGKAASEDPGAVFVEDSDLDQSQGE